MKLVLALVRAQREQQPRLGVRKLYYLIAQELKAAGVKMGRDRLFEELRKAGLLVERKRSEWPKTTNFNPNLPVFKNLIKCYPLRRPNQVWVADITYIRTEEVYVFGPDHRLVVAQDRGFSFRRNAGDREPLKGAGDGAQRAEEPRAAHSPFGSRMPVCVAYLREVCAASGFANEHDGKESQRGECAR